MTYAEKNRDWLEPYIADIQQRMNLSHWRIDLAAEPPVNSGSVAEIHVSSQARRGRIHLLDPEGDMDDLRDSIVHELLHAHLNDLDQVVKETENHFNPAAFDIVTRLFDEHMEIAICAIARGWAAMMPLPSAQT